MRERVGLVKATLQPHRPESDIGERERPNDPVQQYLDRHVAAGTRRADVIGAGDAVPDPGGRMDSQRPGVDALTAVQRRADQERVDAHCRPCRSAGPTGARRATARYW